MSILRGSSGVRPVWKLGGFLVAVAGAVAGTGPVVAAFASGWSPAAGQAAWAVTSLVLILSVTWLCLRLERRGLRDIGLTVTRARVTECAGGFLLGAVLFSGLAVVQAHTAGQSWQLNTAPVVGSLVTGLLVMLVLVLIEELLFRGYAFRQLAAMAGTVVAVAVTSVAFGLYHLVGRPYWGMGAFFVVALPAVGGLVFGYALVRSGGLMLPVGLHWGGNWASTSLFGWQTTPAEAPRTVWTAEADPGVVNHLMSPDLLPHLPYLCAAALMTAVVWYQHRLSRQALPRP